ncbi:MAG: hypothetical protein C4547_04355 [Phycisphaerales bacterium]|nr:MAG: hypothetical protein C4547_04355 [Phycisphaerales bacterium]
MPPAFLKALGRREPPPSIAVEGWEFVLERVFKNDFFAVTCLYAGDAGRVVLKLNRQAPMFGLPLSWIGRWLAAREARIFRHVQGIDGVPRFLGCYGPTGILHEFIPGHAMRRGERVGDDFHPRLRSAIDAMHDRGVAYVDLEKCENVVVGDDGRPYLVDFQISWHWPRRWGGDGWPLRTIRRRLQAGDRYHLVKLQRRTRPDQLTPEQRQASYRRPWYVCLHNGVTRPAKLFRRRLLDRLDPGRCDGERGRVHWNSD